MQIAAYHKRAYLPFAYTFEDLVTTSKTIALLAQNRNFKSNVSYNKEVV